MVNFRSKVKHSPKPEPTALAPLAESTALASLAPSGLPAFAQGVDKPEEIMQENLEGRTARLPQIKVLHAGACMFKFPDGESKAQFKAVILDTNPARAFWLEAFTKSGGGNIPDCYSLDGIEPDERVTKKQSERCSTCKNNEWGSDPKGGRGKACKEMARIHVVGEGMAIPFRLTLPPSSLRNIDDYMTRLTAKMRHYNSVLTLFEATPAQNSDGIEFTQIVMHSIGDSVQTKEEYIALKRMASEMRSAMRGEQIEKEEYESSDTSFDHGANAGESTT